MFYQQIEVDESSFRNTCMTNKNAIYFFIKFALFDSGFATLIFIRLQFIDILFYIFLYSNSFSLKSCNFSVMKFSVYWNA